MRERARIIFCLEYNRANKPKHQLVPDGAFNPRGIAVSVIPRVSHKRFSVCLHTGCTAVPFPQVSFTRPFFLSLASSHILPTSSPRASANDSSCFQVYPKLRNVFGLLIRSSTGDPSPVKGKRRHTYDNHHVSGKAGGRAGLLHVNERARGLLFVT